MFGVRADCNDREVYFANAARRFALDAKMFRCRSAVHVENKDDIVFWSAVLKHFRPGDRFHFIAGSRNEYGHETSGVTQCLKYYNYLGPGFFICIDSDYRYLLQEEGMDAAHYVLQTYTYSFENHHCFADGLNEVCSRVTHQPNRVFDFKTFLTGYSRILYPLFIWHLYFLAADPSRFSKYDFNRFLGLNICKPSRFVRDGGKRVLDELHRKVAKKVAFFERSYPNADLGFIRHKYRALGLEPDTSYLFLRGHNVYDLVSCLCKEVCKILLKQAKNGRSTREAVAALYRERNHVDLELKRNLHFGAYLPIRKLEADIAAFFKI